MRLRVLAITALAACGASADDTIDNTYDACAPLALVSADATEVQLAGMRGAEALWREHGAPSLGLRAGATLEVRFEPAAAPFHGVYDDEHGVIYINDDLADVTTLSIVIAHEVGHAFGLVHVPASQRPSLMNPGNLSTPPTAEDQAALAAIWGSCE